MRRVRGVVHGQAAGLSASPRVNERPSRGSSSGLLRSEPSSRPYSPECVEGQFLELRHDGVLRCSAINLKQPCKLPFRFIADVTL